MGIGRIPVEFLTDKKVRMTQPEPEFLKEVENPDGIARILGIESGDISQTVPMQYVSTGFPFLIVKLESRKAVQRAYPNPILLNEVLGDSPSREILIFSTE